MAPTFKKSKDCTALMPPSADAHPAGDTPDADNRQLLISLGLADDDEQDAAPMQQQHKQQVGPLQAAGQQRASGSIAAHYPHAAAASKVSTGGVLDALRARVEAAAAALQGQGQFDSDARDEVQGLLQDQQHQIDLLLRGQSSLRVGMNTLRRGTKEQEASNEALQQKHGTALRAMEGKLEQAIQQVQQLQQAARNRQQQQADSMQASLQAADQDRAQLAGKVAELQAALDRWDRQLQQAQQQQQQAQQQLEAQLEAQRLADQAAHDQQRSTTTALLADLAADCQAAQAEARSHAAALEAANADLQRLTAQLSDATAAQVALECQLATALQGAQELRQQLQQAQEDRQGLTDRLADRSAGLQQELVAAVQGRTELQVQCDSTAASLLQAQVQVKQAEAKVAAMEQQATALSSQCGELQLQNKGLQGEQVTMVQRVDQLTAEQAGSAAQLAEAMQQLEQATRKLAAGSQDRESHAAKLAALETENQQLVWKLAAQQAEHGKAQRAAAEAMAALRQAADSTSAQLAELQALADKRVLQATAAAAEEAEQCRRSWREEFEKRRQLQNEVITLKGNIRVLARIRPLLEKERTAACSSSSSSSDGAPDAGLRALDEERVLLSGPAAGQQREWEFDRVFGPQHDQAAVYSEVSGLVCSIMDGYSGCVIAYGQTGSGKTHTVEGPVDNPGINSRALTEMFTITRQRAREVTYALSASVLEIYQESLFDLLAGNKDTGDKLDIKEGPSGLFIPGLRVEPVCSPQDVVSVLQKGKQHRSTFATYMNEHSSRSHLVLTLYVTAAQTATGGTSWSSKLHLIDLAGSERVSRSGAEGERLREAAAINKSLSALGDVVSALQQRSSHVPYRNSKLTRLLEDSLGKEAKALLVVNCSPAAENVGETKCSLEFASRARKVELGVAVRASAEQLTCSGSPGSPAATGRNSPVGKAVGGGHGAAGGSPSASSSPRISGRFTGSTGDLRQALSSPSTTSRISRRSTPAATPTQP